MSSDNTPQRYFDEATLATMNPALARSVAAAEGKPIPTVPKPETPVQIEQPQQPVPNPPQQPAIALPSIPASVQHCLDHHQEELVNFSKWLVSTQSRVARTKLTLIFEMGLKISLRVIEVRRRGDGVIVATLDRDKGQDVAFSVGTSLGLQWDANDEPSVTYFGELSLSDSLPYSFLLFLPDRQQTLPS